jgi:hypothetical protein
MSRSWPASSMASPGRSIGRRPSLRIVHSEPWQMSRPWTRLTRLSLTPKGMLTFHSSRPKSSSNGRGGTTQPTSSPSAYTVPRGAGGSGSALSGASGTPAARLRTQGGSSCGGKGAVLIAGGPLRRFGAASDYRRGRAGPLSRAVGGLRTQVYVYYGYT